MSHPSSPAIPPILATVIAHITAAVPARARTTFLDLLLGAAATKGGHVTDAILAAGLSRGWSTYYYLNLGFSGGLAITNRGVNGQASPGLSRGNPVDTGDLSVSRPSD
jgi:hypothetical protein